MREKIETVIKKSGLIEDKKFYNRAPGRLLSVFEDETHYIELLKDENHFACVYGPGFMNGPAPKRFDFIDQNDIENFKSELITKNQ